MIRTTRALGVVGGGEGKTTPPISMHPCSHEFANAARLARLLHRVVGAAQQTRTVPPRS